MEHAKFPCCKKKSRCEMSCTCQKDHLPGPDKSPTCSGGVNECRTVSVLFCRRGTNQAVRMSLGLLSLSFEHSCKETNCRSIRRPFPAASMSPRSKTSYDWGKRLLWVQTLRQLVRNCSSCRPRYKNGCKTVVSCTKKPFPSDHHIYSFKMILHSMPCNVCSQHIIQPKTQKVVKGVC